MKICINAVSLQLKHFYPSRKFSLNEAQFSDYLERLCHDKIMEVDEMKSKLLETGLPAVKNDEND